MIIFHDVYGIAAIMNPLPKKLLPRPIKQQIPVSVGQEEGENNQNVESSIVPQSNVITEATEPIEKENSQKQS